MSSMWDAASDRDYSEWIWPEEVWPESDDCTGGMNHHPEAHIQEENEECPF